MTTLHINRARGHYVAQVRMYGCRRWNYVGGKFQKLGAAAAASARTVASSGDYKRGRVLLIDRSGYCEPVVMMEISR